MSFSPIQDSWKSMIDQSKKLREQSQNISPMSNFLTGAGTAMMNAPPDASFIQKLGYGLTGGSEGIKKADADRFDLETKSIELEEKVRESQQKAFEFRESLKLKRDDLAQDRELKLLELGDRRIMHDEDVELKRAELGIKANEARKKQISESKDLFKKVFDDAQKARQFLTIYPDAVSRTKNSSHVAFFGDKGELENTFEHYDNKFFPKKTSFTKQGTLEDLEKSRIEAEEALVREQKILRGLEEGKTEQEIYNDLAKKEASTSLTNTKIAATSSPSELTTKILTDKQKADLQKIQYNGEKLGYSPEQIEAAREKYLKGNY